MTTSLDLILLPLSRQDGQDQPELMGLQAASAPRRSARGRSLDRLVIHLDLVGTAPLSPTGYAKLLDHLTQLYFKTSGSSTAAMRTVAEWLNEYLLERNHRGQIKSMQAIGVLTLAVLRGNRLYIAQCGPGHVHLITGSGFQHYHLPEIEGRGLGLGRAANIRYHQVEISSQDVLLISNQPPESWTLEALSGMHGTSMGNLHRRLLQISGQDVSAAMLYLQAGSGKLRTLRAEPVKDEKKSPLIESKTQDKETHREIPIPQEMEPDFQLDDEPPFPKIAPPIAESHHSSMIEKSPAPSLSVAAPTPQAKTTPENPDRKRVVGPALLMIGQAVGSAWNQFSKSLGAFIKQLLPDESLFSIPASWMGIIAVAVPLIVVALAVSVYFQRGQRQLFEEHYLRARFEADRVLQLSEPSDLRSGWLSVLTHLDQAESYQVTEDTQVMRNYAQAIIDDLDEVTRLVYQSVIVDNLPSDIQITHLVITNDDTELFILDGVEGRVYRATLTDRGYVIDKNFICEPIPQSDSLIVGKLVDIVALPLGDPNNAVIMGMDTNGNLLQCISGGKAPLAVSMPPPDMNWGTPLAFTMDAFDLYVLDPVTNAVWIFWGRDSYGERPHLFFDSQIPPMGDVVDLTVYRDDLYLLHEDGHLTSCIYSNPTRCTDPAEIRNLPEGLDHDTFMENVKFGELQFVSDPNPSLFLLDAEAKSIYQLSRTLGYHQQFRAQNRLPEGPISTFAVSPNHQVFLAIGNQVYSASFP